MVQQEHQQRQQRRCKRKPRGWGLGAWGEWVILLVICAPQRRSCQDVSLRFDWASRPPVLQDSNMISTCSRQVLRASHQEAASKWSRDSLIPELFPFKPAASFTMFRQSTKAAAMSWQGFFTNDTKNIFRQRASRALGRAELKGLYSKAEETSAYPDLIDVSDDLLYRHSSRFRNCARECAAMSLDLATRRLS